MPTGYTAGILSGQTKTFEEYAIECTRNFGARIMERDNNSDSPYEKRMPSDYHIKQITSARSMLDYAKKASDKIIIESAKSELQASIDYHEKSIADKDEQLKVMSIFLSKAKSFEAPTDQHTHWRDFLVGQLEETIRFDLSGSYHENKLKEAKDKMQTITASTVREELISQANKDIVYHTTAHEKDVKLCAEANTWCSIAFASVKGL